MLSKWGKMRVKISVFLSSVKRKKIKIEKKLAGSEIYKNCQESNEEVNKYLIVSYSYKTVYIFITSENLLANGYINSVHLKRAITYTHTCTFIFISGYFTSKIEIYVLKNKHYLLCLIDLL